MTAPATTSGRYAVRCDACKVEIRRTDILTESAAGGVCDACCDERQPGQVGCTGCGCYYSPLDPGADLATCSPECRESFDEPDIIDGWAVWA